MLRIQGLLLIIMAFTALSAPRAEAGREILAVQSVAATPYQKAFDGFKNAVGEDVIIHRMILSDEPDITPGARIAETAPDLVLAVGMEALRRILPQKDIPIVYVMVLDAAGVFCGQPNITGVTMVVDPVHQLEIIGRALPRAETIGLLYDPKQTGELVRRIHAAANKKISITAKKVYRPENVPPILMLIREEIDLLWMLPDLTVVTPETAGFLFLLAMESGRPIVSFSEKYAEQGALMSIGVDPFDMGRQAAGMAEKILSGQPASSIPAQYADKAVITINARIAGKFGIPMNAELRGQARVIQ